MQPMAQADISKTRGLDRRRHCRSGLACYRSITDAWAAVQRLPEGRYEPHMCMCGSSHVVPVIRAGATA
jgi:hypothetical protein